MNKRTIRWLLGEVAQWERDGLVDAATSGRLRERYEGRLASGRNGALTAFSVLGALLVGAGILLLLAHNWSDLPRWARTGLSLLPLIVAQGLALSGLLKGREGTGWREAVGIFWFLSIGGAIAMVGQVYHLPGSFDRFMLVWSLLALPVVLVLRSSVAAVLYLAATTAWAVDSMERGHQELWYWALLAGLLPLWWWNARRDRQGAASCLLWWGTAIALGVASGLTLVRAVPGLWLIIYSAWSAVFLLVDHRHFRQGSVAQRPFLVFGVLGALVMTLTLTFETPWKEIGWHHYREHDALWRTMLDPVLALGLTAAALALLVAEVRQLKPSRIALAVLPVLTIVAYSVTAVADYPGVSMLLFNLYALAVGLLLLTDGFRQVQGGDVNAGMLTIGTLVMLRFFDSDLDILVRGVVFVLLGAAFLAVNVVLARKKARAS